MKNVFFSNFRTVVPADYVIIYQNEPIFCKSVNFTMNPLDLKGYFYNDPKRESDERSYFHRKLTEKLQVMPNVRETIGSMTSTYLSYFT